MLEVLLVPLVASAASRLVKAVMGGEDAQDAGALAADLIGAMFTRRDATAVAIDQLAAQVQDVRDTQWKGPYRSGMDQLEKAGRVGVSADHRAELLRAARERLADAKGAAPDDPAILATLDVYYGLAWVAEGRLELAKGQFESTAAMLEESILTTHVAARSEMPAWAHLQASRSRDSTVEFAERYILGCKVFTEPEDPRGPGGSYTRLRSLTAEHASLQRLRLGLHSPGTLFPAACAAPLRALYDNGHGAVMADLPRHVICSLFGISMMASLAPYGPNRRVDFSVGNALRQPVEVRVAAAEDPAPPDLKTPGLVVVPGATCRAEASAPITLSEGQSFVMEVRIPTPSGAARIVASFAPEEGSPLLLSSADARALEATRRAGE